MAIRKKEKSEKVEETGGELTSVPNDKYRKFFDKFSEIETMEVAQWKLAHLLGYFCKKYKDHYHVNYSWKFNNESPTKCFEVWQMNTLLAKMSTNPKIIKEYIDWVFVNVVPKAKRRLTSISFMTAENVVNDYKVGVLFAGKKNLSVDRSTQLPPEYQAIFEQSGTSIKSYGDLAFVSQMSDMPGSLQDALLKIEQMGFDKSILSRIV